MKKLLTYFSVLIAMLMIPIMASAKDYYLVGNFMSTDGTSSSSINYNNRIFLMKYKGNNQYTFDVPATITVYSQILVVDGATTQAYGPTSNQTSGPSNDGTISGSLTTASAKTSNYWQMNDRGISSDGMYTYTITVNSSGAPTSWSIKHTRLTRVVYFLPKDGKAQPAYMTRNNTSSSGDNKFFGNVYLNAGQECFVLANIKGASVWTDSSNPMPTVTKLYKQGNGGGYAVGNGTNPSHPFGYDDWHKVYPALSTGFKVTPAGAMTLEYNPSKGQNEKEKYSSNNNIGGEVIRAAGDPMVIIESMKVIGPGVDTDWTLSNARSMTYNETLKCWEITITTTKAASTDNLFRFVANDSWSTNWYEDGTSESNKAKIPYDGNGVGHAATDADPNVVSKTSDAHATTTRDIIFNRPAGTWTIRFYIETISSSGGNSFTYNYYYTIDGEENTTPDATLTPGVDNGIYTFSNYTLGTAMEIDVTMSNCTAWQYSVGSGTTPSINGSGTIFGDLIYDGTDIYLGSNKIASGTNTVTICIRGKDGSETGATHQYTYTFSPLTPLTINPNGGFYINKQNVEFTGGTAPYYYTTNGSTPTTSSASTADGTITLSRPCMLQVIDSEGRTGSAEFDFTYSTSENYSSYMNNVKTEHSTPTGITVFVKPIENSAPYLKAWNPSNSSDVYLNDVQLTDYKTVNGEKWYYYTFDTSITSAKVRFDYNGANGWMSGTKTITADSYFVYDKNNCIIVDVTNAANADDLYDGTSNTVYWASTNSNYYIYIWDGEVSTATHGTMTKIDNVKGYVDNSETEYNIFKYTSSDEPGKVIFKPNSGTNWTGQTGNLTYSKGKLYSTKSIDNPFAMQTYPKPDIDLGLGVTYYTYNKPNGADYYSIRPDDYTWKLLPNGWTATGYDGTGTAGQYDETSGQNWNDDATVMYKHLGSAQISQTIDGLDATKNYTVQAIVRGVAEPLYLQLNNNTPVSITLTADGSDAKTTINKFGRSEQLVPGDLATGRGWHKIEATATPNASGELTIKIKAVDADVSDVVVLEEANTAGHYWTKAPTSETVTEYDMSDRSKYNAFSFFDRGANLNSIIKADQKTVIGMSDVNDPYGESGRRHPCNVVTSNGSTWSTPMLALTDYAAVITGSEAKYGNDTKVSQHAYGTSFAYTADKFSYDRATSAKMMSTMLPFALSNAQVKSMLGNGVKTYTLTGVDKTNLKVTFNETTNNLAAHTPFFFLPSEDKSKMALDESVSVVATSGTSSPSSPAQGLLGTYKHISNVGTTYKNQNFIPYFFQNGSFVWAEDGARAKPFRVIFLLNKGSEARMLNAIFIDDTITGIDGITENIQQKAPVYSIDGKLVSSDGDTSRLSKGVYVKAGKKFIIK